MILIFAFGPFLKWKRNSAYESARELDGAILNGHKVKVIKTRVSVKFVKENVPYIIRETKPCVVLGVGLNPRATRVLVEKVAINILDFTKPDADGAKFEETPIFDDGPIAYFATIPVKDIVNSLKQKGIPAKKSYSAGTYLCNALMYTILYTIDKLGLDAKGGFIHVPPFPDMALNEDIPSMSKELIVESLRTAIEISLK